jgi:oxygen-independent coproporphyrinogen III oxidase
VNEVGIKSVSRDILHDDLPRSLYVHIPFCKSRCFYCDFNTFVTPDQAMEDYLIRLQKELALIAKEATEPLQTVFFGGGTPTMFHTNQLVRMLDTIYENFRIAPDAEISLEANPGSATEKKLRSLFQHGVNRISFGAQSFNDRHLMTIGRLHDSDAIRNSVHMAQDIGFSRINVDLMFGLPDQTQEDVAESIAEAEKLCVEHISAYWLKVEAGTPFAKWQAEGRLPLPGEDAEAEMYEYVRSALRAGGYEHYEISNFAKSGGEAKHNLVYWHNEPYFAAGAGAHGYVQGIRYENVKSLGDYGACMDKNERPIASTRIVSISESMENTMMLGLRLREGVSTERFEKRHCVSMKRVFGHIIDPLVSQGLLEWHEGESVLKVALHAWPIANIVFEKFVDVDDAKIQGEIV